MSRRRDAQRNRELLLLAAEEEFRAHGTGVALGRVADRAGLGRGTLYRNFPDRQALVRAVYDRRLDEVAVIVQAAAAGTGVAGGPGDAVPGDPGGADRVLPPGTWAARLEAAVTALTGFQQDLPGLLAVIRATPEGLVQLAEVGERTLDLLSDPLRRAQEEGTVAADVTREDLLTLFLAVVALVESLPPAAVPAAVDRARTLFLRGMRAPATAS